MKKIKMASPWITDYEREIVTEMMLSGWDSYEYVEMFEREFAKWHERQYALMTPCCTHALHLLLLALKIQEGDEIIVPECTWTGSVAPVVYVGGVPVFCDINKDTWCVDIKSIEQKITKKTRAIIAVDLYGNMPNYDELVSFADKKNIYLIEDAAEALGSKFKNIRAGKFGVAGVHSFHRTKTITTGEGGMLLIDDYELYNRAKFLRDHGRSSTIPYYTVEVTPKYMPSNLAASVGYAQFQRIDELVAKKRWIYHEYKRHLDHIEDIQMNEDNSEIFNGVWATSVVFGESCNLTKSHAIKKLESIGVPARPFFYPLSSLPAYNKYGKNNLKENSVSYDISERAITLSCAYDLDEEQISFICNGIIKVIQE